MLFRKNFKENYTSGEKYFCNMPHVEVSMILEDTKNMGNCEDTKDIIEGYESKRKKHIKPLYFGRDQCQQALDLTNTESDGTIIDTPCNGGNIQCHGTDECSISSCNLSDSNCYPCTMNGCQDCQDASSNKDSACTRPAPIEGGGDKKYCKCKKRAGCGGLDGDDLIDCLTTKHSKIIRCCDKNNPQNICNLDIQAEKVGRVLCVDEDGDRTDGEPDEEYVNDEVNDNTELNASEEEDEGTSGWMILFYVSASIAIVALCYYLYTLWLHWDEYEWHGEKQSFKSFKREQENSPDEWRREWDSNKRMQTFAEGKGDALTASEQPYIDPDVFRQKWDGSKQHSTLGTIFE